MLPAPTVPVPPTPWQNLLQATLPPPPGGPPWDAARMGAATWSAGTTVESVGTAVVVSTGAAAVVSTGAAVVSAGTGSAQAVVGSPASASTAIERMGTMKRFTQTSPINPADPALSLKEISCTRGCQAIDATDYHVWRPSAPGAG